MYKKWIIFILISIGLTGCSSFSSLFPANTPAFLPGTEDFQLKRILLPLNFKSYWVMLSPSGKHAVMTYFIEDRAYVQIDDMQYGPYTQPARVMFSYDESIWVFRAVKEKQEFVVINGKEIGLGDQSSEDIGITQLNNSHFYFNPAGDISFTFQRGSAYFLYWNGKEYKLPAEPSNVYRSPGHLFVHCIYSYRQSMFSKLITRHYMVRDGKWTDGPFDQIEFGPPSWSADGRHYAYVLTRNNKKYVNLDNKISGPLKTDYISSLQIAADGSGFQLIYADADYNSFITTNEDYPGVPYSAQSPQYNQAGLPLVYDLYRTVEGISRRYLIFNDIVFGPIEEYKAAYSTFDGRLLRSPVYSEDHTAYAFDYKQSNRREYVVYNGQVLGPYERAFAPVISQDGTEFGFKYETAANSKQPDRAYFYWNEKIYGPYDHADCFIQSPTGVIGGFVYNMKGGYSGEFRDIPGAAFTLWNDRIKGGNWYFHDGNQASGPFDVLYKARIGYDNRSFGLVYLSQQRVMLQINKRIFGPYAYDFVFTPDGEYVYVTYYLEKNQVIEKVPLQGTRED